MANSTISKNADYLRNINQLWICGEKEILEIYFLKFSFGARVILAKYLIYLSEKEPNNHKPTYQ